MENVDCYEPHPLQTVGVTAQIIHKMLFANSAPAPAAKSGIFLAVLAVTIWMRLAIQYVIVIYVADQEDAQQKFGINRRTAGLAVTRFQLLPHKGTCIHDR